MTNTKNSKVLILLIAAASVGIVGSVSFSETINAQDAIMDNLNDDLRDMQAKAVPGWVDNNFKWYGEGKIGQSDLLNSLTYMLDNNLMHLSDKAAQEMHDLREENAAFKKKLDTDGIVSPKTNAGNNVPPGSQLTPSQTKVLIAASENDDSVSDYCVTTATRSYTDENGNDFLVVSAPTQRSSEDKSSCWVRVSQTHTGDPDRPIITGQVPNPESDDRPTEEVAFYYNKISFADDKVDEIISKGGTTSTWGKAITEVGLDIKNQGSLSDSTVDELNGIVVLCNIAMDKEIQKNETNLEFLKELADVFEKDSGDARLTTSTPTTQNVFEDLVLKRAENLENKVKSLQVGMDVCEEKLRSVDEKLQTMGDDAQLANIDLQNTLQKQQQTMQMMSNIMKSQHDTLKAIINNMRA